MATSRSSSSGMLLHRKNESREASSRSLMRYGAAIRHVGRVPFEAEDESRIHQHPGQRLLDAGIEIAILPAGLVEAE